MGVGSVCWSVVCALVLAGCTASGGRRTLEAEAERVGAPRISFVRPTSNRAHLAVRLDDDRLVFDRHGWNTVVRRTAMLFPEAGRAVEPPSAVVIENPTMEDGHIVELLEAMRHTQQAAREVHEKVSLDPRLELILPADTAFADVLPILYTATEAGGVDRFLAIAEAPVGAAAIPFLPPFGPGPPFVSGPTLNTPCAYSTVYVGNDALEVSRALVAPEDQHDGRRVDCLAIDRASEVPTALTWPSGPEVCYVVNISPAPSTRWERIVKVAAHLHRDPQERIVTIDAGRERCPPGPAGTVHSLEGGATSG